MDELPREASAFLATARRAHDPPTDAADRVRKRVALAVVAGAIATPAVARATRGGFAAWKMKIGLAAGVIGIASGGWYGLRSGMPSAAESKERAAIVAPRAPSPSVPPAAVGGEPAAASPLAVTPAPESARREVIRRAGRPASVAPFASDLQAEMTLLTRAEGALDRGDLHIAKESLRQHRVRFPAGQLRHERRSLELLLKCLAGGRIRSSELPEASGVLASRIARACGTSRSP